MNTIIHEGLEFDGSTIEYYDGFRTMQTVDGILYIVGEESLDEQCERVIDIDDELGMAFTEYGNYILRVDIGSVKEDM